MRDCSASFIKGACYGVSTQGISPSGPERVKMLLNVLVPMFGNYNQKIKVAALSVAKQGSFLNCMLSLFGQDDIGKCVQRARN